MQSLGGLAAAEWMRGVVPWWNPYSGVGLPLAAEMQPGAFFFPFVLLLQFEQGLILLKILLQALTGLITYALLRRLDLTRTASLLGGICYQLSGTFAWFADAPITPIAFLPLFLLGIEQAREAARRHQAGGWALLGVAVAYSLYAAFPETAYLNGLLALAWAILRCVAEPHAARLAFVRKIVLGGSSGLLAAAPLLLPFAQFMLVADADVRLDFNRLGLPREALAAYLMPYLFGPIFTFHHLDETSRLTAFWSHVGGYAGMSVSVLAVVGLLAARREKALRLLLAAWIVVCMARTGLVPVATELVGFVPLMGVTNFARYTPPSWILAAVILAAFALDEWQRRGTIDRRRINLAIAVTAAASSIALAAASGIIIDLWRASAAYRPYPLLSIIWAAGILAALYWLLQRGPEHGFRPMAAVIILDVCVMFGLPLLAGTRNHALDTGAVEFLQRNLGLARFYTLGPLAPNYGGFYRLGSINHNYQPLPKAWVDYVRRHLDPGLDPQNFVGNYPPVDADGMTRLDAFRLRKQAYAATGVRYVVVSPGQDPFGERQPTSPTDGRPPTDILVLPPDATVDGMVDADLLQAGEVVGFAIVIGTYHGAADGSLVLRLCSQSDCVEGRRALSELADNQPARFQLNRPLGVQAQPLRYSLHHEGGTKPVAVWRWRPVANRSTVPKSGSWLGDPASGRLAAVSLFYAASGVAEPHVPVYRSPALEIFELPDTAPYFEARGGACRLTITSRETLRSDCAEPARLVRRELFYEGWKAEVNGRATVVRQVDDIFQALDLPAGKSDVRFSFAPPYIGWALLCSLIGVVGCFAGRTRTGQVSRRQVWRER